MSIELYDEKNRSKRDAFNEITRRRFRDKWSETLGMEGLLKYLCSQGYEVHIS